MLTLAGNLHIYWPLDDDVTNASLEALFYPGRNKDNEERLMLDYPKIHRELAKKGVTLTLLWTEYCLEASAAGKKPYMSTQFNDNYHKWARITKATMRALYWRKLCTKMPCSVLYLAGIYRNLEIGVPVLGNQLFCA